MSEIFSNSELLLPPNPLHFLAIIRYVAFAILIFLMVSPRESNGILFLLTLGVSAVLIVGDVYGRSALNGLFMIFMVRVMAITIPILMAGIGSDKSTRQAAVLVATLGVPSLGILLLAPSLDPLL